jgi:hypothetical protein
MRHGDWVRDRDGHRFGDVHGNRDVSPNWVGNRHRDGDCLGDPDGSYRQREPNRMSSLFCSAQVNGLHAMGVVVEATLPAVPR